MAQPQCERRPLDQLFVLWQACDSNDAAPLAQLIETKGLPTNGLIAGLVVAIGHGHLSMVRYLLERGISICGYIVQQALQARSIPVLEMWREYGRDVNMKLGIFEGTALTYVTHKPALVSCLLTQGANPNLGPAVGPGLVDAPPSTPDPYLRRDPASRGEVRQPRIARLAIAYGTVLANAAALHAAVESGRVGMMARVLELGADVG